MARRIVSKTTVQRLAKKWTELLLVNSNTLFEVSMLNASRKRQLMVEAINEQVMPELVEGVKDILIQSGYNKNTIEKVLATKKQCVDNKRTQQNTECPTMLLP